MERGPRKSGTGGRELLLDLYDRSILEVDGQIARILGALEEQDLLAHAVVAVVADHGDSFGQHLSLSRRHPNRLFFEHSVNVWEETQHVPFILSDPARDEKPEFSNDVASQVDLVPTLLARIGLPLADFSPIALPGRDLMGAPEPERPAYFLTFGRGRPGILSHFRTDYPEFIGFRRGDLKFFVDRMRFKSAGRGRCFLYDLSRDPDELENLCPEDGNVAAASRYREQLVAWYDNSLTGRLKRNMPRSLGR